MANKTKLLHVRLTPNEYARITRKANKASMTVCELARYAFLQGDVTKKEYKALCEAVRREGLSGYLRLALEVTAVNPRCSSDEIKAFNRLCETADLLRGLIENDSSLESLKNFLVRIEKAIEQNYLNK